MSREQFCQVVLLPQGDFARFLRADAEARGRLLGRLFDTRRFAAVEKRLAERRRAAEAQVREPATSELLADAHRMQQAAGDAPTGAAATRQPGDPGLADAVLGWAAVARSSARERLDHRRLRAARPPSPARGRRRSRPGRRTRTGPAAAAVRGGAGARRAAGGAGRGAPGGRGRGWSGPARRRRVAPALELRDGAERRAPARRRAPRHARVAGLPRDLADAGAAGLAAAARAAARGAGRPGVGPPRGAAQRRDSSRERADLERRGPGRRGRPPGAPRAGWPRGRRPGAALQDARSTPPRRPPPAPSSSPAGGNPPGGGSGPPASGTSSAATRRTPQARAARRCASGRAEAREHWLDLKEQRLRGHRRRTRRRTRRRASPAPSAVRHGTPRARPARSPGTWTARRRSGALAALPSGPSEAARRGANARLGRRPARR